MSDPRLDTARRAHRAGRSEEAARLLSDVLHADSKNGEALHLLGQVHLDCRNYELAQRLLGEAAKFHRSAEILCARGSALQALNRHGEALALSDAALAHDPACANALRLRGNSLLALRVFAEALPAYDAYLARDPNCAEAWHNRGIALSEMKRHGDAVPCFDRAIALAPDNPAGWRNRGTALLDLERFDEAIADFEQALKLFPALPYARGYLMLAHLQCCDWSGFEEARAAIAAELRQGRPVIPPFGNVMISRDPADQAVCARTWLADRLASRQPLWRGDIYHHDRLRIAYVSGDLREHPVGILMAGVFEHHDRTRFDITLVSFGPDDGSELRRRIAVSAESFLDVRGADDRQIAAMLREREIDIAVDLMGLTRDCRSGIFAYRPAPVQVNFLGYPGTLAVPWMDYIIADQVVIPEGEYPQYSERVVRLPGCFLPSDDRRNIGPAPSRREAGLPEDAFIFASFNQAFKFQPDTFDVWMRILLAVEHSVLWLPMANAALRRNLVNEAAARGVDPGRLVFAPYVAENAAHLARLSLADLFLDTLPCNAHSTASDALWAGVPVLTCMGTTFAGRVATSLVSALGLPELATRSLADYQASAIALARDADRLTRIRARLAAAQHRLFDTARYTRNLESAFAGMAERTRRGLAPHVFSVVE
jgi:predicted O-linked N-acetylglucosamine transferase (SPINDLY family)